MIPAVPSANPPFQSIVETFGFHSPHVDMSDQIFQTLSAGAVDSTEVPYSAIVRSFLCAGDSRLSHTTTNRAARNRPADQEAAGVGRLLEAFKVVVDLTRTFVYSNSRDDQNQGLASSGRLRPVEVPGVRGDGRRRDPDHVRQPPSRAAGASWGRAVQGNVGDTRWLQASHGDAGRGGGTRAGPGNRR